MAAARCASRAETSSKHGETHDKPKKNGKTQIQTEEGGNIDKAVIKAYEGANFATIASAPVSGLEGIGPKREKALNELRIHTIAELGSWKYFRLAKAISVLAGTEKKPATNPAKNSDVHIDADNVEPTKEIDRDVMHICKAVDKPYRSKSLTYIANSPPSALLGLSKKSDDLLRALNVYTVDDLGKCKWAERACAITLLGETEELKTEELKTDETEKLTGEHVQYTAEELTGEYAQKIESEEESPF